MTTVYPFTKTLVSPTTTTVPPGGTITYEISLVNVSSTGIDYTIDDLTPTGTTFLSLVQTAGPPLSAQVTTPTPGTSGAIFISNANNDFLPGQTVTFLLTFQVAQATTTFNPVGTVIGNTAQLFAPGIASPPQLSNTTTITVGVATADVSIITKGPRDSEPREPRESLKYFTTITNNGPSDASNVIFNQEFCFQGEICEVSVVQLTGPQFFCLESFSSKTLPLGIITLPVSSTATFQTTVVTKDCGQLKVSSSLFLATFDPNLDNNFSSVITTIGRTKSSKPKKMTKSEIGKKQK